MSSQSGIQPAGLQGPDPETQAPTSKIPWFIAATLFVALLAVSTVQFMRTDPPRKVSRSLIIAPDSTSFVPWGGGHLAISPDGTRLAFVAEDSSVQEVRIWVRPINSLTAFPLAGTEGAYYPVWSADSRYIAFFAKNKLKKIDASRSAADAVRRSQRAIRNLESRQHDRLLAPAGGGAVPGAGRGRPAGNADGPGYLG